MNEANYSRQMQLMAAMWPDYPVSEKLLAAYWRVLGHIDDQVWQQATDRCMETCTFFPKPVEILTQVERILESHGLMPKGAEAAWNEVLDTMITHNPYGESGPGFSNPDIGQVVDELGGFTRLGRIDRDRDLPFARKEFLDRYTQVRRNRLTLQPVFYAQALPDTTPAISS